MANIEINTTKLRECGQDTVRLATEYVEIINDLFQRMYQVPTVTEEWVGTSSTNYANLVIQDKDQYIQYGNMLKKYGNSLINYADSVDEAIRNTREIG